MNEVQKLLENERRYRFSFDELFEINKWHCDNMKIVLEKEGLTVELKMIGILYSNCQSLENRICRIEDALASS